MVLADDLQEKLITLALEARHKAYAPYSNYTVGAALLAASGQIYQGVNIENAAYPAGICAERVAVFKAVSEGERGFQALAVATENGGAPCGSCRQVMAEFNLDMLVLILDSGGRVLRRATVRELLPGAFGPADLGK